MSKTLLVVECQGNLNWYNIFKDVVLSDGKTKIVVEQAEWDDIIITSYCNSGVCCSIRKSKIPLPGTSQMNDRTVEVHFVLLRSVTWSIKGQDSRNKLFALMHGNLPSVNSLVSAYMCLEKPTVYGALKGIEKKLGRENFPLIKQTFWGEHRAMLFTPDFPIVAKVGHTHAGYGKMKFESNAEFSDFRGLIALHGDYVTAEPFIDWDFDMRIQKIGPHYRGFKRMSPNWKGNVGNQSIIEDMEVTDRYKLMVDECAKLFGGLDIIGLDLVHSKADGKEYILELNDTAIGLVHKYEREDMEFMADIVVSKMSKYFIKNEQEILEKADSVAEEYIQNLKQSLITEKKRSDGLRSKIITLEKELKEKRRDEDDEEEEKGSLLRYVVPATVAIAVIIFVYYHNFGFSLKPFKNVLKHTFLNDNDL